MDQILQGLTGALMPGIYLAGQLPVMLAAGLWAKRFRPENGFEFLTVAGLLYALLTAGAVGVLGLTGHLSWETLFVAAWCLGGIAAVTEREYRMAPKIRRRQPRWSYPELGLLFLTGGLLLYQCMAFLLLPPVGTDALIYHLYYPALWLKQGWIERVTQPGLMTSSYPCYGELIYTWQMGLADCDFFAKNFQFFFLAVGICACVAGLTACGFRRVEALAAATLLSCSGVIFRNAAVSNTDLMVGSGIVCGVALFACGMRRKRHAMIVLGGIAFGFAAGTKYLGLLLAPPALLFFGALLWKYRPHLRRALFLAAAAGFLTAIPCFIANWIATGNPFYPVALGFGASMATDAPPVGWTFAAWNFFVNDGKNNLSVGNAIILLGALGWAGVILPLWYRLRQRKTGAVENRRKRQRMPFPVIATAILAAGTLVLLLIELKFYPSMTQPRQIIPVAMLAAGCSAAFFRTLRDARMIFVVTAAGCFLSSFGHLDYRMHGPEICLWGVATVLFFLISDRLGKRNCLRWSFFAIVTIAFVIYTGFQFAAANAVASLMRGKLITPEDEECRLLVRRLAPDGAVIAYNGAYYYQHLGDDWRNCLLSIPISESGRLDNHDYPDWNAMRTPTAYETYRQRLFENNVAFLICDTRTFAAPHPEIEVDWALAHPETFVPLLQRDGFYCFAVRGGPRQ